jgi:hypothetical protein
MTDLEIIHQFAEQNMLVERYLLKELTGADLEDFEQHLFQCDTCFDQVKAGRAFMANISAEPSLWQRLKQRIRESWARHFSVVGCAALLQLGPPPQSPPPPMRSPFWEGFGIALSISLAIAAIGVFAFAVYQQHFSKRRKP